MRSAQTFWFTLRDEQTVYPEQVVAHAACFPLPHADWFRGTAGLVQSKASSVTEDAIVMLKDGIKLP